jgi:hypothetical protein
MIPKHPCMLTPRGRRAEELGLGPNLDGDRKSSGRIPFHADYVGIIEQARAMTLGVLELSIEPASAEKAMHLKDLARLLKRHCNQLTYRLAKAQKAKRS